jgi:hypothetical protein
MLSNLATLLLVSSLASAGITPPAATPAAAASPPIPAATAAQDPVPFPVEPEAAACAADTATLLPAAAPAAPFAAVVELCGSCSEATCPGSAINGPCTMGNVQGFCNLVRVCPQGGFKCLCLVGSP